MKSVHFVCLFAILISMLVPAQSNRDQLANQPNGLPVGIEPRQEMTSNVFHRQHGSSFAQRTARTLNANATRRGLPPSGLNFGNAVAYPSGGIYAYSVAAGDVNGDGKPDLVVANECNDSSCDHGAVGVLLGNGDGTFQPAVSYGSGGVSAQTVQVADVNADGKLDLVVANCTSGESNCTGTGAVGVLLGNGDGTFQPAVSYGSGGAQAYSVAAGDVNGDGKPDLVVANECNDSGCDHGAVGVLLGNGDGTFQPAVSYGSGGFRAHSVQVADVNADGKPDVLVANHDDATVGVLLGNGDGTFQTAVPYNSGAMEANSVAVADVNADGKPDLLVADACVNTICANGAVGVLLGNGDGTFQTAVPYGSGGIQAYSVVMADVDRDGKPDLLVANQCAGSSCDTGSIGVLLGNGDGTFQTVLTYSSGGSQAVSVVVADVNGDSKPELLVANFCASSRSCGSGTAAVLINTSLEATTTTLVSSLNPSSVGQGVTFTATVIPRGTGTPTGTASFFDGTTNIGNSSLDSHGVAVLTTSTLSVGTHGIAATYNGDSSFGSSTSPVLYQVVQGAIALFSPTSLNFGNQTIGITSTPQVVTLTNTGNINLTITSIQVTGANRGDFAQTNKCSSSLPPNGSCNISVTFRPKATGTRSAAVRVADNAPDSPQSVPLTGVGVLPAVTFSPASLTFPTQVVFTTSPVQQVTLTNTGAGVLTINHISVTGPFRQTNNCPSSLNPGANCTINVKFHPTTKGVFHGAVSVRDNAPASPQRVPLTGKGTFVQLAPAKVSFGTQPVGTRSLAKKITLTNKGSVTVYIKGISITGADARDFAETNACGKSVAAGASCFIKVTFKPIVKGKRTADVSIRDDGGGSPQKVGLIGTGT